LNENLVAVANEQLGSGEFRVELWEGALHAIAKGDAIVFDTEGVCIGFPKQSTVHLNNEQALQLRNVLNRWFGTEGKA